MTTEAPEQCSGCPHDPHAVRCFRFKPGRHRMEQCPCKERTNGLRSNRAALAGDGAGDSDRAQPGPDAQQDVGERRVEFDFADVTDMEQEMEQAREGRDA